MKPKDRRAARAASKEKKSVAGIFALRCLATGAVWVGATPDVDKIWNRLLQAAWNAHGEAQRPPASNPAAVHRVRARSRSPLGSAHGDAALLENGRNAGETLAATRAGTASPHAATAWVGPNAAGVALRP